MLRLYHSRGGLLIGKGVDEWFKEVVRVDKNLFTCYPSPVLTKELSYQGNWWNSAGSLDMGDEEGLHKCSNKIRAVRGEDSPERIILGTGFVYSIKYKDNFIFLGYFLDING